MFNARKKLAELDAKIARHEQAAKNLMADWRKAKDAGEFEDAHVWEEAVYRINRDIVELKAQRLHLTG